MKLLRNAKKGATMVEYGLLVALIAVVLIFIIGFLGQQLQVTFTNIANAVGK